MKYNINYIGVKNLDTSGFFLKKSETSLEGASLQLSINDLKKSNFTAITHFRLIIQEITKSTNMYGYF